jgi:glutamine amidotransferase
MLAIVVDTGLGNVRSVEKALETAAHAVGRTGIVVERTRNAERIRQADRLIVPGQGAFRDAAAALDRDGLRELLLERLRAGVPYLGICLGLQLLFETSDEAPGARGLGWFAGHVRRLHGEPGLKIPHMGWNQLEADRPLPAPLEAAGGRGAWVYFVHSYHAVPEDESLVIARSGYGRNQVTAAVARDNVLATQFHPEKSQRSGLALLSEYLRA